MSHFSHIKNEKKKKMEAGHSMIINLAENIINHYVIVKKS
jgi:hypothetical protein